MPASTVQDDEARYNEAYAKAFARAIEAFDAVPYADSYACAYATAHIRTGSEAEAEDAAQQSLGRMDSPVQVHA